MKTTNYLFLSLFITINLFAQKSKVEKTIVPYYYYDTVTKVKQIGRINPESVISLQEKPEKYDSTKSFNKDFTTKIVTFLIPKIIEKLGPIFYKPEKFAKSNSANLKMIALDKFTDLNSLDGKILTFANISTKGYSNPNRNIEKNTNAVLNFSIHKNPKKGQDLFKILKFDNYLYKYTSVKLKNRHHKVNLVIEINVSYFNEDGILQSHKLKPIEVDNVVPLGEEAKLTAVKQNVFRYIPTKHQIEAITITLNEVNTRKKVWDKWLKYFNDNQSKASDFIIDKITPEKNNAEEN